MLCPFNLPVLLIPLLVILYMRTLFPIYGSTYNSLKVPCDFILLCLCIPFSLYVEFSLSSLLSVYLRNLVSSLNQGIIWHYLLWRSYFISSEDLTWNPKKCNHLLFCPPITCTYFLLLPFSFCRRMAKFIFLIYLYIYIYIYFPYYTEFLESTLSISVSGCLSGIWSNQ